MDGEKNNDPISINDGLSFSMYRDLYREFDAKIEVIRESESKSSKKYSIYTNSILAIGLSLMTFIMGVNSYNQYNSIWAIADSSNRTMEVFKNNLNSLENSTRDKIENFIGTKNISGYQIINYDENKNTITALTTDVQRKYEDYNLYSVGLIVPIKILGEGDALGELLGIVFRVTGPIAEILSRQNGKLIESQVKIVSSLSYFGLKDVFFQVRYQLDSISI